MLALEAEGTGCAKIVAMAVAVTGGDGRKGFEAVLGKLLPILLNGKAAHQSPVGTGIGLQIIAVVFAQASQKILDFPVPPQILCRLFYGGSRAFSPGTAGRQGKNPGKWRVLFLIEGSNILFDRQLQCLRAHLQIHPADGLRRCGHRQKGQQHNQKKQPLHIHHLGV